MSVDAQVLSSQSSNNSPVRQPQASIRQQYHFRHFHHFLPCSCKFTVDPDHPERAVSHPSKETHEQVGLGFQVNVTLLRGNSRMLVALPLCWVRSKGFLDCV